MNQSALFESSVSEYRALVLPFKGSEADRLDADRVVRDLSRSLDWTEEGAQTIVLLATKYGAFMLRNALALAVALDKEDGDLGF
jgi:hypothetical protein